MPNWCNNYVVIRHDDRSKMTALAEAAKKGNFCKHVIPVPKALEIVAGRVGADGEPEQVALEAAEASNRETYGFDNWYDFCVARWGTKWDVDPYDPNDITIDEQNYIKFGFDSAWSPPMGVYEQLVEDGYTVTATYYEPGMAFVGCFANGSDECYDISGMRSDTVRDLIGEELDDWYGISETMAEYEAEDELDEELYQWTLDGAEKKKLSRPQKEE